ncbi:MULTISPECIES: Mur ligase domain-containing protein, partial [unclassified Actinomyces]
MSNHAYESAAALRPHDCVPTALADLAELLSLTPAPGDEQAVTALSVNGVSVDSADTAPGELFVALPGFRRHGAEFTAEAVAAGAVAVLTDAAGVPTVRREAPGTPV